MFTYRNLYVKYISRPAQYSSLDPVRNKVYFGYKPIVTYTKGTYPALDLTNLYDEVTLQGDTRGCAGLTFMHCASATTIVPHWSSNANVGVGKVTLSSVGNNITISCATTNPDFGAAGNVWGSGDKLWIVDSSKALAEYTIDSVSANTITLTGAAPTINAYGCSVTFVPNRIISANLTITNAFRVKFRGFHLTGTMSIQGFCGFQGCSFKNNGTNCVNVLNNGDVIFTGHENTIIGSTHGLYVASGNINGPITTVAQLEAGSRGIYIVCGKNINIDYSRAISQTTNGLSVDGCHVSAQYITVTKAGSRGIVSNNQGFVNSDFSYVSYCTTTGWYASNYAGGRAYDYVAHNNGTNFDSNLGYYIR